VLTYHLVPREEHDRRTAEYLPSAFAREGFIHTTRRPEIVHEVGNRYYRADPRAYLLLVIELDLVPSPWRYDAAGEDYPHIYGPVPRVAIREVLEVPRGAEGAFLPVLLSDSIVGG
jgi:uncharacterized protein (DUF952 family)